MWFREIVYTTEMATIPVERVWEEQIPFPIKAARNSPRICFEYRLEEGKPLRYICWDRAPIHWLGAKMVDVEIKRYRYNRAVADESFPHNIH